EQVEQLLEPVSTMLPYVAKFLEMHATGDRNPTMAGLRDDLVDIFRKHYAMDIYRGLVVPLYLR
ncbi:unnamed protein product, partial [Brassica oleracea var. botrytis]